MPIHGIEYPAICLTCYKWNDSPLGTKPLKPLSIWINRGDLKAFKCFVAQTNAHRARNSLINNLFVVSGKHLGCSSAVAKLRRSHPEIVAQPALTKVNKQIRAETLPVIYGAQAFLFTLFDRDVDIKALFKWLRITGKENAALITKINVVYRKKKDKKYIRNTLLPVMRKLGVRTEAKNEVVVATRLPYPFCFCEECVRKALGEA